jgi:carbon-monoxide dehydrogenase medium subunit
VKPAPFNYHAPTRISDVVALLAEHAGQASLLAGGQALMPLLASRTVRPRELIDLNRVPELSAVTRGGSALRGEYRLRVGALARLRQLEKDPDLRATAPLLSAAAALAGPVQVRHRATVGGAMAYADPAAEFPAVALALDARVELRGDRVRHLPVAEFLLGAHRTARRDTEVLTAVEFPTPPGPLAVAIEKVAPRSTSPALAGAVVVLGAGTARLVLFGVAPTPVRATGAESALAGGATAEEVADAAVAGLEPPELPAVPSAVARLLVRGAVLRAVATARGQATARDEVTHV